MQDDSGGLLSVQLRETVRVMLVGFDQETAERLEARLGSQTLSAIAALDDAEALDLFVNQRLDIVIVDIDHTENYAPHLIRSFRSSSGLSAGASVIAVAAFVLPGLRAQITRAGADAVYQMNGALEFVDPLVDERISDPASACSGLCQALTKVLSERYTRNLQG